MTEKLYDLAPYQCECECRVRSCDKINEGWKTICDRTVFYARGGGQPCEPGTIDGIPVLDVYEQDGEIWHILEKPVEPGPAVMRIDMPTRLEHMRQHLGEHIMSAVIEKNFGGKISILRIESESSHIEIDRELTPQQLFEAERLTNEIIARDLPVNVFFLTPDEAAKHITSAKAAAHEQVRIVEIPGVDFNGCGGTHCKSTGEVGRLLICGGKMVRGQFRIYFKCGGRAENELHARFEAQYALQRAFDSELFTGGASTALDTLERKNKLEEQCRELKEALTAKLADIMALAAKPAGKMPLCVRVFENEDAKLLKAACDRLTDMCETALVLACVTDGQASLMFCRSKSKTGPDFGKHLKALVSAHGGRGGGSIISAQGMMEWNDAASEGFARAADEIRLEFESEA